MKLLWDGIGSLQKALDVFPVIRKREKGKTDDSLISWEEKSVAVIMLCPHIESLQSEHITECPSTLTNLNKDNHGEEEVCECREACILPTSCT